MLKNLQRMSSSTIVFTAQIDSPPNIGLIYCVICGDNLAVSPIGVHTHIRKHVREGKVLRENLQFMIKETLKNLRGDIYYDFK